MDEKFIIFCKNRVSGKHFIGTVENIGLGGLIMKLSPPRVSEGDVLLLEGRIGKRFRFKETAAFHSRRQDKFVFEFIELSDETTEFLEQLAITLRK